MGDVVEMVHELSKRLMKRVSLALGRPLLCKEQSQLYIGIFSAVMKVGERQVCR